MLFNRLVDIQLAFTVTVFELHAGAVTLSQCLSFADIPLAFIATSLF